MVRQDGELESVLKKHLNGEAGTLTRTLLQHVGETSPLLKILSPERTDGVVAALRGVVETALQAQREQVLGQFTLDDPNSALSRLVAELTDSNGSLREEFSRDVEKVRNEFSLDRDDSALSRLVNRIEKAQRTISDEFSLDNDQSALSRISSLLEKTNSQVEASLTLDDEGSPLSRLRREMLRVIDELKQSNQGFHSDVRSTLEAFKVRREEAARSTTHGLEFQDLAGSFLEAEARRLGDVYEATGNTTGTLARCKVGDHLITLGPDSAAPSARIVVETKSDSSYNLKKALSELETARQNREAQVGLFIWDPSTAPEGSESLSRYGNDVVVLWDPRDKASDPVLKAAISLARALTIRERAAAEGAVANLKELETAISRIGKDAEALSEIVTWSQTVENNGRKIREKAEKLQDDLENQVAQLADCLEPLHEAFKQ